jgi:type I restriction enzyme S subunit
MQTLHLDEGSDEAAVPGLNRETAYQSEVAVPPRPEQRAIADFLDRETARIDALVAAKERLLGILAEKRHALISRAVTRGLDSNVRLRDSGLPWLGKAPEHWQVLALKRLVVSPVTDGPHETPDFVDTGVPFVSAEAVWGGRVHLEAKRGYITREAHETYSQKYCPKQNDVYVVKSGATTGKVAIVDLQEEFNIWSPLAAIRCDPTLALPRFVFHALGSDYFQGLVKTSWSDGTQPNIGMEVLENLSVIVPPVPEQLAIVEHIERETAKLDALRAAAERTIGLLKERRAALITVAVTGKVDVTRGAKTLAKGDRTC